MRSEVQGSASRALVHSLTRIQTSSLDLLIHHLTLLPLFIATTVVTDACLNQSQADHWHHKFRAPVQLLLKKQTRPSFPQTVVQIVSVATQY